MPCSSRVIRGSLPSSRLPAPDPGGLLASRDASFLASLPEQDQLHFRNLALVRPQLPSESQLQLLVGLAGALASPRLLTLMARTPHWLCHWPILLALAGNEATPEGTRRDLELVVSLFDQMRELDQAPAAEKPDREAAVKALHAQLGPDLRPVAKRLAKQLARPVTSTGTTLELPPLPPDHPDWEALTQLPEDPVAAPEPSPLDHGSRLARASHTLQPEELLAALVDPDPEVRRTALQNPLVSEELLCRALVPCTVPGFFAEVYAEAKWYFRTEVRESLLAAPAAPEGLARRIGRTHLLVETLATDRRDPATLRRIISLFRQLDEDEYHFITHWVRRHAPHLLRVVKHFYDRLPRRPEPAALPPEEGSEAVRWSSLEARVALAARSTQEERITQILRDPAPGAFHIALENPALSPGLLAAALPTLGAERVEALAAHATWPLDPLVAEALAHHPALSEASALALLDRLPGLKPFVEILRDPRIPHLEVRRRALDHLRRRYLALRIADRITALRASGGELLRHLPQEVLQDGETLLALVADPQLDPGILLRLARNKLTPQAVLKEIARHPARSRHSPISAELLLNPTTPRETAARLWGRLPGAERRELLRSPHLPATLRTLGPGGAD